jgi:amino acid transporter
MVAADDTASPGGAPGPARDSDDFLISQRAEHEKRKLRKEFGRLDVLFFLICGLVSLDTIGTLAKTGAQSFTWLVVLAAAFFVPYGLLTAELGSAFP